MHSDIRYLNHQKYFHYYTYSEQHLIISYLSNVGIVHAQIPLSEIRHMKDGSIVYLCVDDDPRGRAITIQV